DRGIAWLARDYAMTVLPAVSSLRALREFGNSEHASAPFLGIGDPVLKGKSGRTTGTLVSLFRGATADVEKVRALPPLPEIAAERKCAARGHKEPRAARLGGGPTIIGCAPVAVMAGAAERELDHMGFARDDAELAAQGRHQR